MNSFDVIVESVLSQNEGFVVLRPIVEKEILHHDILRIMNAEGFLEKLVFMGGTCLRMCYGSQRLSEDLDFTGGFDFSKTEMQGLASAIKDGLESKYKLDVTVSEPHKEEGNTDTWKIKLVTKPERPDLLAQKINIDICHLPSHDGKIRIPNNYYGVDLGTNDLLLRAESLEEILCDKLIAFANRPNRVKNRDLWDIFWLSRKNVAKNEDLLQKKLSDRGLPLSDYKARFSGRIGEIAGGQKAFLEEMRRFLFPGSFTANFTSPMWWEYLLQLLTELS